MKKGFFLFITFLYFLSLHAVQPNNQCIVILTRGETSYLVLSQNSINYTFGPNIANELIGTGNFQYFIGDLGLYIYDNLQNDVTITISSSKYEGPNVPYQIKNGDNSCKVGIYANFDLSGNSVPFYNIIPTSNPYVIRSSTTGLSENHVLFFYLLQDEENNFINGVYTAIFTLAFGTL